MWAAAWTVARAAIGAALPSTSSLILWGGIVAGVGLALGGWSIHEYNTGWKDAINAIAAEDKEAIDARNKALDTVRSCRASGGVFRPSSGDCEKR